MGSAHPCSVRAVLCFHPNGYRSISTDPSAVSAAAPANAKRQTLAGLLLCCRCHRAVGLLSLFPYERRSGVSAAGYLRLRADDLLHVDGGPNAAAPYHSADRFCSAADYFVQYAE